MANDLNQCQFIGRLGADPETRYTAGGDPVCSFRIAVGWKSKDKEGAEWVSFSAFGKLAEICGQYLRKGSQVFCQGRHKTDKFTDKEGNERYSTKIILDQMQMLGKREGGSDSAGDGDAAGYTPAPRNDRPQQSGGGDSARRPKPAFDDLDDGIPF